MKRLFTVTVETEVVVVAESASDAEEAALDAIRDLDLFDFSAFGKDMTHLPAEWELRSIPYGERDSGQPNRTIEGWIEHGAGEKYRAALAAHAARVAEDSR